MKYITNQNIATVKIKTKPPKKREGISKGKRINYSVDPIYLGCKYRVNCFVMQSEEQLNAIGNTITKYVKECPTPSLVGIELLLGIDDYKEAIHYSHDPNLIRLLKQAKKLIAEKWISQLEDPTFYLSRALGYYEKKELDINIKPPIFNLNLPPEEEQQDIKELINEE